MKSPSVQSPSGDFVARRLDTSTSPSSSTIKLTAKKRKKRNSPLQSTSIQSPSVEPGDFESWVELLAYEFKDPKLSEQALKHSSFDLKENYEQLEWLGDTVLGNFTCVFYFKHFQFRKCRMWNRTGKATHCNRTGWVLFFQLSLVPGLARLFSIRTILIVILLVTLQSNHC